MSVNACTVESFFKMIVTPIKGSPFSSETLPVTLIPFCCAVCCTLGASGTEIVICLPDIL